MSTIPYGQLRAANRGGGIWSDAVSQRAGSLVASRVAWRWHPTVITLIGASIGVLASVVGIVGVAHRPTWVVGLVSFLGWQLAYALDCADGQLARATGRTSVHGARVDILCDYVVQTGVVATVVTALARERHPHLAPWLLTVFAVVWFVNLFAFALSKSDGEPIQLVASSSPIVAVLKSSRDYGLVVLLVGAAFAFWRRALPGVALAVLVVNGAFLLGSVGNEALRSMRATKGVHMSDR